MTEESFIAKWKRDDDGSWGQSASAVFWVRAFDAPDSRAELVRDFLRLTSEVVPIALRLALSLMPSEPSPPFFD